MRNAYDQSGKPIQASCLAPACSAFALALLPASALYAQEPQVNEPGGEGQQQGDQSEDAENRIVVIGNRAIVAPLNDIESEQDYDEDRVASYNVSTVGELLDQVRVENGDSVAGLLINGQPVRDAEDISDLPVEAIERIEQLPRGTAQRIGGGLAQRAYNIVLKPAVKSATITFGEELATEGDWSVDRGEALFTYVRNQDRMNVTLRGSDSPFLLESDRALASPMQGYPFAILGNALPFSGTHVDPALSAVAGKPVTIVALNGAVRPTLADLIAGANRTNPSPASDNRTLRSSSRPHEVAISGNKTLTPKLSLSFNGRLNWSEAHGLRGLPSGRFLVPATNPNTPFSTPVFLALSDSTRPLRSDSSSDGKSASVTLNANFADWHGTLLARYSQFNSTFVSDLQGFFPAGSFTVDNATNPFSGNLVSLIPVTQAISTSHNVERELAAEIDGVLGDLPAGPLIARAALRGLWSGYKASDSAGSRTLDRHEVAGKAGITIPLTGPMFLEGVGSAELALDYGQADLGRYGTIDRYTVGLNWSPLRWLRITTSQVKEASPVYADFLAAPAVMTDNVPYFDPIRNETAYVRVITGGTADLLHPEARTRAISLTMLPLPKYGLRLTLDYQQLQQRHLIGYIPTPNAAVLAAFPDRFVRDPSGVLVQVDTRSVNFHKQVTDELRFGVNFTLPVTWGHPIAPANTAPSRQSPGVMLQLNLTHTHLLNSTTVIRPGLPEVDLLSGGAIGIGGGQQRDTTTASVALTKGASGVRLNAAYRGPSYLLIGSTTAPGKLTFGSILDLDLRAFADLDQLMRDVPSAEGVRLSLVFDNILNDRQQVTNLLGITPQAYQPAYRDPVGRTVMFEIRKVF